MPGLFVQSTSKALVGLEFGLRKTVSKLEDKYKGMLTKQTDLCRRDTKNLQKDIDAIIAQLNVLIKLLNNILGTITKILKYIKFVAKLIVGLTILIKILKFFPLPSRWTTVGMIVKFSDLLAKIQFQLKTYSLIIIGLDLVISSAAKALGVFIIQIQALINSLQAISDTIINCANDSKNLLLGSNGELLEGTFGGNDFNNLGLNQNEFNQNRLNDLNNRIALANRLNDSLNRLNSSLNGLKGQLGSILNTSNSYKGFVFAIVEEETTDKVVAKRRYAIALNSNGVLALTGELSYATDTKVLIDELKLRIDNENLSGYVSSKTNQDPNNNAIKDINGNIIGYKDGKGNIVDANGNIIGKIDAQGNIIDNNDNIIGNINDFNNANIDNIEDEQEFIKDLDFDSVDEIIAESQESEKDIDDLLDNDSNEKKLKDKFNKKQKRFVKFLEKKSSQGDQKATEILNKINSGEIAVSDAKKEWLAYKFLKIQLD